MQNREIVQMTQEEANNTPAKFICNVGNLKVTENFIPYTYTSATRCFFVDHQTSGKSYGSCGTLNDAMNRAIKLVSQGEK